MTVSPELRILRIGKRQQGVISRAQALTAGLTDRAISRHLVDGTWTRLGSGGVYLLASSPWGWRQRNHAALLAHPLGVLGSVTAARIYGLDEVPTSGLPYLTVPPGARAVSPLAVVHRSSLLRARKVDGFNVNALPLVFREIAATHPDHLAPIFESALVLRRVRVDQVSDAAVQASVGRHRGARHLRELLAGRPQDRRPTQGKLERWLYGLLEDPRFPPHEPQASAPWNPGHEFVDAFLPEWKMVIEADGRIWHTRIAAIANDTRRDQAALTLGIITIRVSYVELRDDPEGVIARILATARAFGRLTGGHAAA